MGLAPLLNNVLCRNSFALHGPWATLIDQANLGQTNPMMHGGVGRGERHEPDELLEYSFEGNDTLQVPGDWNTQRPELFWYRGVVWYRKDFEFSVHEGNRAYLYFGAVNFHASIYLNGTLLAEHRGGFTPFNIDVSDHLHAGSNRLIVKVDSISTAEDVPTEFNDWLNYGGITREVLLIELPGTFIRSAKVQLAPGRTDVIRARVELGGAQVNGHPIRLRIPGLSVDREITTDEHGCAESELACKPRLWCPEDPHRYRVEIRIEHDVWVDNIGFRSLCVDAGQIRLNGQPVFLRGISLHEEKIYEPGRAWGPQDAQDVLSQVRKLGANFVRLAHYPHNEYLVRELDAAGILVWCELPVYHAIAFSSQHTLDHACDQYSAILTRDVNRACMILLSIANETEPGPDRNQFLTALADHVRMTDPTRLITAALHGNHDMHRVTREIANRFLSGTSTEKSEIHILIDDPLDAGLDVVGYNEYFGWYSCAPIVRELKAQGLSISEGEFREFMLQHMSLIRFETPSGKPIIVSEFGSEAVHGRRSNDLDIFSEDYQARLYRQQLAMLAKSPAVRGISPWILKDFRSPYRLHTRFQHYWNRKGLLSADGQRKLAFAVLAEYYASHVSAPQAVEADHSRLET